MNEEHKRLGVILPDGSWLSRHELPAADTVRWVPRRKARVAAAVMHGLITREEAMRTWALSAEELDLWIERYRRHGVKGLAVRRRVR